jgi:hypothetical protein
MSETKHPVTQHLIPKELVSPTPMQKPENSQLLKCLIVIYKFFTMVLIE